LAGNTLQPNREDSSSAVAILLLIVVVLLIITIVFFPVFFVFLLYAINIALKQPIEDPILREELSSFRDLNGLREVT
jgi:flagellar basal body-associated protein FliL